MPEPRNIKIPSTLIDAIDGLPDAAFLVADDGTILAVNSAAASMFEYSRSQLIGSHIEELMPSSARSYHLEVRTSALADRRPRDFSSGRAFDCERRGGDKFRADIMLSPTEIDGVPMTWASVRDLDRPSPLDANRQQVLDTFDAIGQMAASTFDLGNDFSKVASRFNEIIPHDRMSVMLISEQDPQMVEVAFLSGEGISRYEQGSIVPLADSATGWVAKAREMTWFNVKNAKFAPPGMQTGFKHGIIEGCGVPLFDGDDVIGMLGIETKNPDGFSEFQRGLIQRLASHLSVAVMNQRMRIRLTNQNDEIEAVGEIARIVSSSPDLDSAFSVVSELIEQQVVLSELSVGAE
ncbi:MAG: PAS domain S-box protein [Chloroflexi bacterium]|nr:PAS domain S-box protein [Chloroflexota bacterium]